MNDEAAVREKEIIPERNNGNKVVDIDSVKPGTFVIDTAIELKDFKGEKMRMQDGVKEDANEEAILDEEGRMIPTFTWVTVGSCLYTALGAFSDKDEPSMKKKRWRGAWKKKVADAMGEGESENPNATGNTLLTLNKQNISFLLRQVHLVFAKDTNILWASAEILDPGSQDLDLDGEEPE